VFDQFKLTGEEMVARRLDERERGSLKVRIGEGKLMY
jgi:hypothetical protein